MARSGPTAVSFAFGASGSQVALPDIVSMSGGGVMSDTVDTTVFSDGIRTQGAVGTRTVEDITLTGFFDPASGTAFSRIGRPDTSPGATVRLLTVTYQTGVTRTYQVIVVKNEPMPSLDGQTMFEAVFRQAGTTLTEDFTP